MKTKAKRARAATAKLSAPRLPRVYARTRLFAVLDRASEAPALWIEGPPGAGKTTLVASWLAARRHPHVWYQVDEGDADPATLFHYLGIAARHAAPRYRRPLPHLTPEFVPGLETFARRYFEELFRRLGAGTVLVLDNVHDAGAEGPLNDVLRIAVETLPSHARLLFVSRAAPPPAFARTIANGQLAALDPALVRLSLEEARGVAAVRGVRDAARIASIHDRTQGWTAGLVLMLERAAPDSEQSATDPETLFDYFATEILRRLDEGTREVLLKSALLPRMRGADVDALVGRARAGDVVADLRRRNYFTYRLGPKDRVYEYHPLFREFLLARLHEAVAPHELDRLRSTAAGLLEASGQSEAAADLWRAAGDWPALAEHVRRHAERLVREGRARVVEGWLAALPRELIGADPWLVYWRGACLAGVDPATAAAHFSATHGDFRKTGDAAGVFVSWAAAVDAIFLQQTDAVVFDAWFDRLDRDLELFGGFPSIEIEAGVVSALIYILLWRRPWHADMARWAEKATPLLERALDSATKARLACVLMLYYRLTGDHARAGLAIAAARGSTGQDLNSPAAVLSDMGELYDSVFAGRHADSAASARALLGKCAASGLRVVDHLINGLGVYGALSEEDLAAADDFLASMERALSGRPSTLDTAHWHALRGWRLRFSGDFVEALRLTRLAADACQRAGAYQPGIIFGLGLAQALFDAGELDAARAENAKVRTKADACGFFMHVFECVMFEARIALARGDESAASRHLVESFELAKRVDVTGFRPFWRRQAWAQLHAAALERGVFPEVVRRRIREERLSAYGPESAVESWPWPVRVRVLGRFSVQRDDKPLAAPERAAKPLELLKALVALGGRGVSETEVAEMLWPSAEGDRAHQSLKVTVHRLRRLLGEECIVWSNGVLSLDSRRVWVDAWALERALGTLESAERRAERIAPLARAALALWRGPYLRGESAPWAISARERLRAKFLRVMGGAAEALIDGGQTAEALQCCEKALEVDPAAERFYQGLMRCHLELGQRADGLAAYRRCRDALSRELALPPSPKTEALRGSLLSG